MKIAARLIAWVVVRLFKNYPALKEAFKEEGFYLSHIPRRGA